jgi:anti-sigma factor ChrR (cupin superfamily)
MGTPKMTRVLLESERPAYVLPMDFEPKSATPYRAIQLTNLFQVEEFQDRIPWKPFRDGVEIHHLYGDGIHGPSAALIRYRKAAHVPMHEHLGYEHIIVLSGSQKDQNGEAAAGTLTINPPGTRHELASDTGCIVLAIYEKPVKFV